MLARVDDVGEQAVGTLASVLWLEVLARAALESVPEALVS